MKATRIFVSVIVAIIATVLFGTIAQPVLADDFVPTQEVCQALADDFGNVAQLDNPDWVACFTAGWVNWVFSSSKPLPVTPPEEVQEALKKSFVQLTEPWRAGCDNTLLSPHCSIGFLKLFNDWGTLRSFLELGEFSQAGMIKSAPWTDGSLWMTNNFMQVAKGDAVTAKETELFCQGALGWAFALDGEFILPEKAPCSGDNTYFLRERWAGGCIGDQLPDTNCNVGEILTFSNWQQLVKNLDDSKFKRGSVFANHPDMLEMSGIIVPLPTATLAATATKPSPTATLAATATKPPATTATKVAPATTNETTKGWPLWAYVLIFIVIVVLLVYFLRRKARKESIGVVKTKETNKVSSAITPATPDDGKISKDAK